MAVSPEAAVSSVPEAIRRRPLDARPRPSWQRRPSAPWVGKRAWLIWLALGALAIGLYFSLSGVAQNILYDAIRLIPGVVLFVVVRHLSPGRARAWYLFGAGEVLFALGDIAWDVIESTGHRPFPSVADACYLAGYALIVVGLLRLIRLSTGQELPALIDASIGATGVGLVLWFTVFAPVAQSSTASNLDLVVSSAYPIMDLFLLVVAARLVMGGARRTPTFYLLVVGVVSLIASDVAFALAGSGSGYKTGAFADLGWLVTSVVWTAAVLHPSMADVGEESAAGPVGLSTRRTAVLVVLSLLGPIVQAAETGADPDSVAIAIFAAALILLIWGRFIGLVREHLRHRVLEAEIDVRRAGEAERQRIARELHDFVTHSLGAVMLQAGGAHRLLTTDTRYADEALAALEVIERRSGEALEEMRTLLDVLRRGVDDDSVVGGVVRRSPEAADDLGSPPTGRSGEPGPLRGLAALAADARRAGLEVELREEGDLDGIPRPVALSAYRIVQESLNNACRHAPGSSVRVVVHRAAPGLVIEVTDDGGAPGRTGNTVKAGPRHGLVGMRERAAFLEGEIEAGPMEGGGWRVRARLPVAAG